MNIMVKVKENPLNIGNGFWNVGKIIEVTGETKFYYTLRGNYRVNKKYMSLAGTACGRHSVKLEIVLKPEKI